ncbi:MAG TPA: DUF1549 and DUF1553 domain-containing protein [Pirellulales bacterium]|nr:DUF1549 and DUF1553 domain-containing protein [Pirellulales bacterium]
MGIASTPGRIRRIVFTFVVGLLCANQAQADERQAFRHGSWPFRPPLRPATPTTGKADWVVNPIDAFVVEKLTAAGLRPSPAADKLTLLRRVSFDLIGLPPTPAEQADFLADERADAYERLVERLLASPAFGERWAQHWLDLVRYAESDGFKADEHRPNAYKYRDFVIRALNEDMPYDRFIAWQLAGDELEPENPLALIATGYNRLYPDEYNAGNLEQRRQEILDDMTGTTGLALLGMTMGCAQCHDHKFDEILQTDYFRLQAFFTPVVPRDDLVDASPADIARHQQQMAAWEEATRKLRAEIDSLLDPNRAELREYALGKFRSEIREVVALPPERRTPHQEQIARMALRQAQVKDADAAKKLPPEAKQRYDDLQKRLAEIDHLRPPPLPVIMGVGDVGRVAPVTFLLEGGNWAKPSDEITPGFPEFLGEGSAEIQSPISGANSTGRRTALARWITRPDHPLTARVIVNRLWQHHFGVGIVPTPNDFGIQGEPPTHRELLDWLAVELVEHGGSLKHLHRLMVTSASYRQSSRSDPANPHVARAREVDPQNRLLWHARRRRLEGESARDAMLHISGQLNLRAYGPSARPELPEGISKNYAWRPDERVEDRCRRSIYVLAKRNLRYPLFEAFDLPDMHHSCPRRSVTTTAPQSLLLLNGELTVQAARDWADKLRQSAVGDEGAMIALAYREAFGRSPGADEIETAREFLRIQAAGLQAKSSENDALVDFCHALLNANEFLYVD